MRATATNRLEKIAIAFMKKLLETVAYALQLILIDLMYGNGKYRKRTAQPRTVIHHDYHHHTIVYRELLPSERVTPRKLRRNR
jgi:hypothetical protein